MIQTKKMNEATFAKLIKEFQSVGELIRARQEEKQSIIDSFGFEKKRYSGGKLSKKALESSVKKTNKEFSRLDKELKRCIVKVNVIENASRRLASQQEPRIFIAKTSGIFSFNKKVKRKSPARKKVKKKAVRKK